MTKKDGGAAFPVPYGPDGEPGYGEGMTLRDYFAVHATRDDINAVLDRWRENRSNDWQAEPGNVALRYMHADAMLAERETER